MQQKISLRLLPSEASNDRSIRTAIANSCNKKETDITGFYFLKRSLDARGKTPWINITVNAFINEPFHQKLPDNFHFPDVSKATRKVVIIGAGPAGLFAALKLIEAGIRPVVLERGKDVRARRRDLAILNKEGIINPESNYCFGEGGAGTYSDGKLYTRSSKRGDIDRILQLFVHFGAEENILYEAHPHIGTNKLPGIITAMRTQITNSGGDLLFQKKVTDLLIKNETIIAVKTSDGDSLTADAFVLATGHSARDIFILLNNQKIIIEPKPFALGVRIEHPQTLVDNIQYGFNRNSVTESRFLPPSSYSLVEQVNGKGVFSFCMCPGGIIAPASTNDGEIVVNGWSPSKRNNPFANSGIVVPVEAADLLKEIKGLKNEPLMLMRFQEIIERKAFDAGGGKMKAPAQRMIDFVENKLSSSLPKCSYLPGIESADIAGILPAFIHHRLQAGFRAFGKKMHGYFTNEAVVVATESRTSSPVRIPRTAELHHPQIRNLFPCGEGAGYAGGIVSAAMDGERIAARIATIHL